MEEAEPSEEEEHLSETGEPEAPPVLLRQCTVLIAQEGGPSLTDDDFPVGCFEIPATDSTDPATVAIVLVAELDHRLVACIPFQCWHRVVNKRVLPPKALIKPLVLELPFVDRTDTEAAVSHQKCWLGVLAPEFEDYVVFEASLDLTWTTSFCLEPLTVLRWLHHWWRLLSAILASCLLRVVEELVGPPLLRVRLHHYLVPLWIPDCKPWRTPWLPLRRV